MPHIFVDMDGVIADFDKHYDTLFNDRRHIIETHPDKKFDYVEWEKVANVSDFFGKIPPLPDYRVLWEYVTALCPNRTVLTGIPHAPVMQPQAAIVAEAKRKWVGRYLGTSVEVITCLSKDKKLHIRESGDIIIDDWDKYRSEWVSAGGIWISHRSAYESKIELDKLRKAGHFDRT